MAKKFKGEDGKFYVQKKPFYKKWWVWVIALFVIGAAGSGGDDSPKETESNDKLTEVAESVASDAVVENVQESTVSEEPIEEEPSVPTEFKSALNSAKSYSDMMHMSKMGLYGQLTSEYGEQFSPEAAQYAIDNVKADWNANALKTAENYSETMYMSKAGLYDQLVSENGEQFTAEEAQYAIDNIQADWNANALKTAQNYQESMSMSPEAIRDQLTSDYGEKFTQEEADYAIANLN